ncbi:MAG: type secretion protein Rhs [Pedosphaera sp.]|nr:type secretion protein Rhs [Pedosphaera sp.]
MVTNNFDAASRLASISDRTNSAAYSYLANSPLVQNITFQQNGTTRMTTIKSYDNLNRLTSIGSANGAAVLDSHAYAYNAANQRSSVTNSDGSRWAYGYDTLGQVNSGKKYWTDATPVAGEQFGYTFDDIGNRTSTDAGGNELGIGLRHATYGANTLNQYTNRTVPAAVDILGDATNTATVTVNNQPTYRKGTFYRAEMTFTNSSSAVYPSLTNLAVLNQGTNADLIATTTGNLFLPQTPEQFSYDLDGNLTSDGRWTNRWDAENRLISMESLTNTPAPSKLRLTFAYDSHGRRITKAVEALSGATWNMVLSNKFVYDGWNLVAELNGTNNAAIRSYMWGMDVSGSMQGAGGVGGLLAIASPVSAQFTCFDGNGNIAALVDPTSGAISGQYEYGPFGELLHGNDSITRNNPFRFSTKYQDEESAFLYYGYRYYCPLTGSWLSRDPSEERGGENLYGFVGNNGVDKVDVLGLEPTYADDKHYGGGACNPRSPCSQNLERLIGWTREASLRFASDFGDAFLKAALAEKPVGPGYPNPKVTNAREAWNNHRAAYLDAVGNVLNCTSVLIEQKRDGRCGCKDCMKNKDFFRLQESYERARRTAPPYIQPPSTVTVIDRILIGVPGSDAAWLWTADASLVVALSAGTIATCGAALEAGGAVGIAKGAALAW